MVHVCIRHCLVILECFNEREKGIDNSVCVYSSRCENATTGLEEDVGLLLERTPKSGDISGHLIEKHHYVSDNGGCVADTPTRDAERENERRLR